MTSPLSRPTLDRLPHFDEQSRQYPIRSLIPRNVTRAKRIWTMPPNFPLDQGSEGACVGFGWSGELSSTPVRIATSNASALSLYQKARAQDRAMGNNWSEGASVLAGAKACVKDGTVKSYRWAFGIDDVIDSLVTKGPVVLGINWYDSMYETTSEGLVTIDGPIVGGHCIITNGYWPAHPKFGDCILWTNSWGKSYGINGQGFIRVDDLNTLLKQDGEAVAAVDNTASAKSLIETVTTKFRGLFS